MAELFVTYKGSSQIKLVKELCNENMKIEILHPQKEHNSYLGQRKKHEKRFFGPQPDSNPRPLGLQLTNMVVLKSNL